MLAVESFASVQPHIKHMSERRILLVRADTADFPTFPDACRHAVGTLFAFVALHNIPYVQGSFAGLCPYVEDTPGSAPILPAYYQASVTLPEEVPDPAPEALAGTQVQVGALNGGRELVGLHIGPYETLTRSWEILDNYRKSLGEQVRGGIIYDVYVDDPAIVPEAEMRTEMHFPLW